MKNWFVAAVVFLFLTLISVILYLIYLKKYNKYINLRLKNKEIKKISIVPDNILMIVCLPLFLITCFLFLCFGFATNNYYYGYFGPVEDVHIEQTSITTVNPYNENMSLERNIINNGKYVSWEDGESYILILVFSNEELCFETLKYRILSEDSMLQINEEAIRYIGSSDVEQWNLDYTKTGYRYAYYLKYKITPKYDFEKARIKPREGIQKYSIELLELYFTPKRNANLQKKIVFKEIDRVLVKKLFYICTDNKDPYINVEFRINDEVLYNLEIIKGVSYKDLFFEKNLPTGISLYDYLDLKGEMYLGDKSFNPMDGYKIICNNQQIEDYEVMFYDTIIQY